MTRLNMLVLAHLRGIWLTRVEKEAIATFWLFRTKKQRKIIRELKAILLTTNHGYM